MNLVRRSWLLFLLAFSSLISPGPLLAGNVPPPSKLDYPKAKSVDQVDHYHGTKVADPYPLARRHRFC